MDLLKVPPRERAGATTAGRYNYQKDISLCYLLEYHLKGQDYLFVFDYHDDLVIANSETNPTKFSFFQIKTKDKNSWTLNAILKRETSKKGSDVSLNSILGRLYLHAITFTDQIDTLNLISNNRFNCVLKQNRKGEDFEQICLDDITDDELIKINNKLKEEFATNEIDQKFSKITFLKVVNMNLKESDVYAKGKLSAFLHERCQGKKYNSELVYQNLFDDIKKKTAYDKAISSFEDLVSKKGIGRAYFEKILSRIGEGRDYDALWLNVSNELSNCNIPFGSIHVYKKMWHSLEIDRMNPTNNILKECIDDIIKCIEELDNNAIKDLNYLEVVQLVKTKLILSKYPYDEKYIDTIIFSELA